MATRVQGLSQFIKAADHASRETKKLVRDDLREAAEPVKEEGERLLLQDFPASRKTAQGFKVRVRRTGIVAVEQTLGKSTGTQPQWGRLQMEHALEPALDAKGAEVEQRLERAVDHIADRLEHG